jgi:hypothetical protein
MTTTEPQAYTKRPVDILAMQLPLALSADAPDELRANSVAQFAAIYGWVAAGIGTTSPRQIDPPGETAPAGVTIDPADGQLVIRTLEGDMKADWGDFIIRGVEGEFYPCKPGIFAQTYSPKIENRAENTHPGVSHREGSHYLDPYEQLPVDTQVVFALPSGVPVRARLDVELGCLVLRGDGQLDLRLVAANTFEVRDAGVTRHVTRHDDWVDPRPWLYPDGTRSAHKLAQTNATRSPRSREQYDREAAEL